MTQLLDVKEAAQMLGCSEFGVRRWAREERLPIVRLGRLIRIRREDLDRIVHDGLPHRPEELARSSK